MTKSIEERIETLERQNRRLKLVGGSTIGLVLLVALLGQATSKKAEPPAWGGRVIEAESFVLRDKKGVARAELKVVGALAGLALYDENGKHGVSLTAGKDGPAFSFYDSNNKRRMFLSLYKDGPSLGFYDTNDNNRMLLGVYKSGPSLGFYDTNNKNRMLLGVSKDGPSLGFYDTNDKTRMLLSAHKSGPSLDLRDSNGQGRAILGVSSQVTTRTGTVTNRPESSLVLYNKENNVIWKAPQD